MTTKETLDAVENTLDLIEDNLDMIEKTIPKRRYGLVGGVAVVALVVGAVSGYFYSKRRLEKIYEEVARLEIEQARLFYEAKNKKGRFSNPSDLAEKYKDENEGEDEEISELNRIVSRYQGVNREDRLEIVRSTLEEVTGRNIDVVDPNASEEPISENIFDRNEPEDVNFDYETELQNRTEDAPYVISYDEFTASEKDYQQVTLTYFEGDDILADERDKPVEDVEKTVGNRNLLRFGHGSKDNNIVYIRNHELELEFEVCRSNNKYATEVLGYVEHSDRRRPRRFRSDDD